MSHCSSPVRFGIAGDRHHALLMRPVLFYQCDTLGVHHFAHILDGPDSRCHHYWWDQD